VGVLEAVGSGPQVAAMLQTSAKAGISVVAWRVDDASEEEYRRGFDSMSHDGADALFVSPATENINKRQLIVELAAKYRLPAMYPYRLFVEAGGLLSYGPDVAEILRYCARSIDKIMKGANPAFRIISQPNSNSSSISEPPRRSALPYHLQCLA
jgi:putative ABC transport system substrate-binding protein